MSKRISYTPEFKAKVALKALKEKNTMAELVQEFKLHAAQITRWKSQLLEKLPSLFDDGRKKKRGQEPDIEALYAEIGRLQTQINFLKKKSGINDS